MPVDYTFVDYAVPDNTVMDLPQNCWVKQPHEMPGRIECGVFCFEAAAKFLGRDDLTYDVIKKALNPRVGIGTEQLDILNYAIQEFDGVTGGSETYQGGLAIASIVHFSIKPEGTGHYVVFLGLDEDQNIHYYCPWLTDIVTMPFKDLKWTNSDGEYIRWTCNFPV